MIGLSLSLSATYINRDEIVVDTDNALTWQDSSDVVSVGKKWNEAKAYCQDLSLAGFSDWTLPTVKELLTITDKTKKPSTIFAFKHTKPSYFWSSSENVSNDSSAWGVNFKYGYSNSGLKSNSSLVRCVRRGQSKTLTFDSVVPKLVREKLQHLKKPNTNVKLIKDQFETQKQFEKRVTKVKAKQKREIAKYKAGLAVAKEKAKKEAITEALEMQYGKPSLHNLKYDAENGYFVAGLSFENKKDFKQKVAIKVPRKMAKALFQNKDNLQPEAVFDYDNGQVKLKRIEIPFKKKYYLAQFTEYDIDQTQVAVNLTTELDVDMSIDSKVSVAKSDVTHFDGKGLKSYNDLDKLLARAKQVKTSSKKWLFVVGIEQYEFTDNISFASRSAKMFAKMAQKSLGVPKENAYVLINGGATQAKIKTKMKKMLRRVAKGDTIYFYYNGHGVPVPSLKNEAFMLTSDSEPDFVQDEKFFSLQNIYSKLSDSKAGKVVAVVDSCFSGVTDGKAVLKGVAATRVVAKKVSFNKKKMVVLTAGKGNQYSNGYSKKGHRLFSFFVMKHILEGSTDVKSLFTKTKSKTYNTSMKEYGDLRVQEPTVDGNLRLKL